MDWNKTKTIFIIVFSILNVFLFSLYLNRYNEDLGVKVLSSVAPIEDRLLLDNIKIPKIENTIQDASYVSGNVHMFTSEELDTLEHQIVELKNGYSVKAIFDEPIEITEENTVEKILKENILKSDSYKLWEVDEDSNTATFFQKVNGRLVYFNQNAKVTLYWNDENEVVRYEQTILDNLEDYKESKKLLPQLQAIEALHNSALLKPNAKVKAIELGYSTLVQLTETQVFAPTWKVQVKLEDGTLEEYFVNAVEGRIIEIPKEVEQTSLR